MLPQALLAAYGSLQDPNYAFVTRALQQRPYQALVAALEQRLVVEDITDPNYDVSFSYVLGNETTYLLQLSMVGPFGALFPLDPSRTMGPALIRADSVEAQLILDLLSQHGVCLVDNPTLAQQTAVQDLFSGQALTLYQALFTAS